MTFETFDQHLRHWLQYWQLRTWINDNLCTWQLIVTLDSICNSCDVFFFLPNWVPFLRRSSSCQFFFVGRHVGHHVGHHDVVSALCRQKLSKYFYYLQKKYLIDTSPDHFVPDIVLTVTRCILQCDSENQTDWKWKIGFLSVWTKHFLPWEFCTPGGATPNTNILMQTYFFS